MANRKAGVTISRELAEYLLKDLRISPLCLPGFLRWKAMKELHVAIIWATSETPIEDIAWVLYCDDSAGAMSAVNNWSELGPNTQQRYLEKARVAIKTT
jgi:hypothetical protein